MKPIFNNYFYGTKNELRGIIFLICSIFILSIINFWSFGSLDNSEIDREIFYEKANLITTLSAPDHKEVNNESVIKNQSSELFYFNPNTTSKTDFERLGLSPRTAQSIINYRNKGGRFFKPKDFKRIYTLSEYDYNRLSPYISIPNTNFSESNKENKEEVENEIVELFKFNPNNASKADFERLGLSPRTAQSIINYRNKGGIFFKPKDLKKIYTLNNDDYERLEPYIQISEKRKQIAEQNKDDESHIMGFAATTSPKSDYIKKSSSVKIDINKATVEDFQQLKGIGQGFAKRIITYRNKLGGFVNTKQLKEVYGFPKETYEVIENQLIIKSKLISKININTATYESLVTHPYIDSKRANAIVKYRKQHGSFKSVNDLSKIYAISKSTLKTIKPYLTI